MNELFEKVEPFKDENKKLVKALDRQVNEFLWNSKAKLLYYDINRLETLKDELEEFNDDEVNKHYVSKDIDALIKLKP